jgi:serine/threonine protein kinase/tetratricopeptide (TPR) repeat protein
VEDGQALALPGALHQVGETVRSFLSRFRVDHNRSFGSGGIVTPERWQQVKGVLEEALERDPGEREAFVAAACVGDRELRDEVESLLAAENVTEDFIETPLVQFRVSEPPLEPLTVGERVGAYRILQEIGRGGMGSVYLAARADEAFEKRVAIKVIRRGMDTEEVVRRFRSERQILANLDHPNIAKLLDGGATEDGRPYFVMEHIEGRSIDEYCKAESLPLRKRLDLFLSICSAVQLAHQNLIVHRDLKPGNILVTADGTPKLLDFGIAKLLDPAEAPMTRLGTRPMTPEYASPEQLNGALVTTASDVYSLGVLLYVLLTGRSPYRPSPADREALARAIREEIPPKPSSIVVQSGEMIPQVPEGDRRVLRKRLAGDLDNIVLMAMRKEPERRYSSVDRLAGDLRRYLDGLPVVASRDTWRYRARKFVGRHRLGVSLAAVITLVLIGSSVWITLLWQRAEREKERATAVAGFLENLFEVPDPNKSKGETVTAREVLDAGAKRIAGDLKDQPELQAYLMETMARVYRRLGLYDSARKLHKEALRTRRNIFGNDDLSVAETLYNLAFLLREMGDDKEAEPLIREALEIQRRQGAENTAEYASGLNNLAALLQARSELDEAEKLYHESMNLKTKLVGAEHEDIGTALNNIGGIRHAKGDLVAAETYYRQALSMRRKLLSEDHTDVAITLNNLAVVVEDRGNLAAAEPLYREVLAKRRKLYGERHPAVAQSLSNLGSLLQARGDARAAEPLFREAVSIADEFLPNHPNRGVYRKNLAGSLLAQGRPAEAEPAVREALEIFRKSEAPALRIADAESVLGGCMAAQARFAEAEPLLLGAYKALRDDPGATRYLPASLERVVGLYTDWGKPDLAEKYKAFRKM